MVGTLLNLRSWRRTTISSGLKICSRPTSVNSRHRGWGTFHDETSFAEEGFPFDFYFLLYGFRKELLRKRKRGIDSFSRQCIG